MSRRKMTPPKTAVDNIREFVPPPGIEPGPRTSEARVLSIKLWEQVSLIANACIRYSSERSAYMPHMGASEYGSLKSYLCAGEDSNLHVRKDTATSRLRGYRYATCALICQCLLPFCLSRASTIANIFCIFNFFLDKDIPLGIP